ncbi:hypothetical protein BOO69_10675 [Sulfitobacter alexandrii]|uniref:Uncharacterized protein n=1 Tax=Sulfitobacter alexandrii TaxID=1917485 RepID=A0A1J0WHM4_9RHOB|nr:hypothetical protein [Sulfitobacter alexandrii]APE43825.1 hypothetical protein BOO69_10675 [Sulfitobacter alexandrii]
MVTFSEFLRHRQHLLISVSALYLTLYMVAQWPQAAPHVWLTAAVVAIYINLSYLTETSGHRTPLGPETLIALLLIGGAVLGLATSPAVLVVAIFAQGIWHLLRRLQHGLPLMSLDALGCFVADMSYGLVLLVLSLR